MSKVVQRHLIRCVPCQEFARPNKFDSPNYAVTIRDILKHWSIDFAGPFPPDPDGNVYLAVMVEGLTRWAEIYPCKSAAAVDAANAIYYQIVTRYGVPESIQSDNGPHFANEVIRRLLTVLQIRHKFSTPYYPQSNGRAERLIGSLKTMMVKSVQDIDRVEDGIVDWLPVIHSVLYVYRTSPHHATGVSPAYLLYGLDLDLPFKFEQQPQSPRDQVTHKELVLHRLQYLRNVIPGLRSSHYKFAISKEGRKVLIRPERYQIGEKVLLERGSKQKKMKHSAFTTNFVGPYLVAALGDKGTYKLRTIPKKLGVRSRVLKNLVNWSRIRRYIDGGDDEFDPDSEEGDDEPMEDSV